MKQLIQEKNKGTKQKREDFLHDSTTCKWPKHPSFLPLETPTLFLSLWLLCPLLSVILFLHAHYSKLLKVCSWFLGSSCVCLLCKFWAFSEIQFHWFIHFCSWRFVRLKRYSKPLKRKKIVALPSFLCVHLSVSPSHVLKNYHISNWFVICGSGSNCQA